MLTKEDIQENLIFLKKIIDITYENTDYSTLKANCKKDLAWIDNLSVSWIDEYQSKLTIDEQNAVMNKVIEVFLIWYTSKNKLRAKAFIVKLIEGDNTDYIIKREYKFGYIKK